MLFKTYVFIYSLYFLKTNAARILSVSPIPSLEHQVVFYPLVTELAKRGHEVTFITTDPQYPEGNPPKNLKEVDLKELSYSLLNKEIGEDNLTFKDIIKVIPRIFEEQMKHGAVQNLIKNEKPFDLLLLNAWCRPAMIWSYIYKVPVIKVSPFGMALDNAENFGTPEHPVWYPDSMLRRVYNLTLWETIREVYKRYDIRKAFDANLEEENAILKRLFGPDVPSLSKLQNNADMLLLNTNHFWDRNRPLPRNVVYFGHVHQKPVRELPQDIKTFLDSPEGAIYMSLGTNVLSSNLPSAAIQMFFRVFSKLPYKVLWEADVDELSVMGKPDNVMIRKRLPQSDILRHANLKLIITQGDQQTTEEAIHVGVPLIGIPVRAGQWLNVENCVQYGIGLQLDMETVHEELLWSSVMKVIEDSSYKDNIIRLRTLNYDSQTSPLDRAILWTEYVLKHSGATHLKSPASNMSWSEYFELKLLAIVLTYIVIFLCCIWYVLKYSVNKMEAIIADQARNNNNLVNVR